MRSRIRNRQRATLPSLVCLLPVCLSLLCLSISARPAAADDVKPKHTNRLASETSPYLLLHAHNPVDWYPWGPEAFEKAKKENKPIFLSVGYSSCYWCHVMERLVFADEEIAKYMNEHFVNIKVDREERPDVDDIYMTALQVYYQAIGSPQSGGWPLSMFLTPEGEPFAGGTYFPPKEQEGLIDFPTYMSRIVTAWTDDRGSLKKNAQIITDVVRRVSRPGPALKTVELERGLVDGVLKAIIASHDPQFGGVDFSPESPVGPKFPSSVQLELLQFAADKLNDKDAARVLDDTLDKMALGGIRDHLGGGFHRYTVDRKWKVPHFEKMLYDQAQLAELYAAEFRRTGKPLYRDVAVETLDFVRRELTDKHGGFYCALDAETEGVEGKTYIWTAEEIAMVLGNDDAALFKKVYGFNEEPAFEHGYALHMTAPLTEIATELKTTEAELDARLAAMRQKLLGARQLRTQPRRDDKVLTSWNGLTIRALARCGAALDRPEDIGAAANAAQFILAKMHDDKGRLLRSYRGGTAKVNAYLEDYACLVEGLLALHEATHDDEWLAAARKLTDEQIELFWDNDGDGFYFTSNQHEGLIARMKDAQDSILPSGNSVSVGNFSRLAQLTGEEKYRTHAVETLVVFAPKLQEARGGTARMALALAQHLGEREEASNTDAAAADAAVDGAIIVQVAEKPPAEEPKKDAPKKKIHKIAAKAYLSVDKLPAGGTCRIAVHVDIDEGWHINTNPAHPDMFIPTELTIKAKQGTTLKKVVYPAASRKLMVEGVDEPLHVYEKHIVLVGELAIPENPSAADEELEIQIRYQACNENACLPPKALKLLGKLPIAGPNDEVKQVNQDKFPQKPKRSKDGK